MSVLATEVFFLEAHFLSDTSNPSDFVNLTTFMADFGYVPYDFSWFGRRRFDGALSLCEIVFVRRNGYLRSLKPGVSNYVAVPFDQRNSLGEKRAA
jgi:hypothetical protein